MNLAPFTPTYGMSNIFSALTAGFNSHDGNNIAYSWW